MKHFKELCTLALLLSTLLAHTGCESSEMKKAGDDVMDAMHKGVDVITDAGNATTD